MEVDYGALSEGESEYFFLCKDGYFKGVLVRLKTIDPLNINMKVYVRYLSRILSTK